MNFIRRWWHDQKIGRYARQDAESGEYDARGAIVAVHGACPERDPLDVTTQNVEVRVAQTRVTVQAHQHDLHQTEDAMTDHVSPRRLRAGIGMATSAETVGMSLLLRDLNTPIPERYLLALPLAMFMFFILGLIVQLGTKRDDSGKLHRAWWVPVIYGGAVLIVVSFAVARMTALSTSDGFTWTDAAGSIVMLATVLGPSAVAEHLFTKLRLVAPLEKKRKLLAQRLAVETEAHIIAISSQEQDSNERKEWRALAARSERVYRRAYRNAGGTVPPDDPPLLLTPTMPSPPPPPLPPAATTPPQPFMPTTVPVFPPFVFPTVQEPDKTHLGVVAENGPVVKPNGSVPDVKPNGSVPEVTP